MAFSNADLIKIMLFAWLRGDSVASLSAGTQAQIALLFRLAFARMLVASGRIALVFLDDALVFTDDERSEPMCNPLIVSLGGNTLRIVASEAAQAPPRPGPSMGRELLQIFPSARGRLERLQDRGVTHREIARGGEKQEAFPGRGKAAFGPT